MKLTTHAKNRLAKNAITEVVFDQLLSLEDVRTELGAVTVSIHSVASKNPKSEFAGVIEISVQELLSLLDFVAARRSEELKNLYALTGVGTTTTREKGAI